jgi:hypothetical protein
LDTVAALLGGDSGTLGTLEYNMPYIDGEGTISKNPLYESDVTFLDFSAASDGGSGTIAATVVVPQPASLGLIRTKLLVFVRPSQC